MAGKQRSISQVDDVLEKAKLNVTDCLPVSQSLFFCDDVSDNDLILMEVDENLFNTIQNRESVVLRGQKSDEAVLCTEKNTFEIKEAEISNALLLAPDCLFPDMINSNDERKLHYTEILGMHHIYYELRICKPRIRKLRQLLEENLYCGKEYEENESVKYRLENLKDVIQASETEIIEALVTMHACYIKGFWRLLDHDYHFRVVTHIMEYIDANFDSTCNISKTQVLDALEDLEPRSVLEQVFSWYADREESENANKNVDLYTLNETNVCRFYAEVLLRPADKFILIDFLQSWKGSVLNGMSVSLSQLEGLVLSDTTSSPAVIWFFPEYDLPENVNERFNLLFKTREKWTYEEIKPFIENLTSEKLDVNALLTKYSRMSNRNGIKIYSSKRPLL